MRKKVMPVLTRQDIRQVIIEELQFRHPDLLSEVGGDNPDAGDVAINTVADLIFAFAGGFLPAGWGSGFSAAGVAWYIHRYMESSHWLDKTLNGIVAAIMGVQVLTSLTVIGGFATGSVQAVVRAITGTARQIATGRTLSGSARNVVKFYQGSKSAQTATKNLISALRAQNGTIKKIFLDVGGDGLTIGAKAMMTAARQQGGPVAAVVVDSKTAMEMSKLIGNNYVTFIDDLAKALKSILAWKGATAAGKSAMVIMNTMKQQQVSMNALKLISRDPVLVKIIGTFDEPVKFILKNGDEVFLKGLYVGDDVAKLGTVRVQLGASTATGAVVTHRPVTEVIQGLDSLAGIPAWKRNILLVVSRLGDTAAYKFLQSRTARAAGTVNLGTDVWQMLFGGTGYEDLKSPKSYEALIKYGDSEPGSIENMMLNDTISQDPARRGPSMRAPRSTD